MNRPESVVAVMIIGMSIASLAGCTAAPVRDHDWPDRMNALFSDPKGQGGGGGGLEVASGAKSATGSIVLPDVPVGEYDVLAVCTGPGTVRMAIKPLASPRRLLASSDIACGATLRLPVTVTETGIVLEAINTSSFAQWQAAIVSPGGEPTRTTDKY